MLATKLGVHLVLWPNIGQRDTILRFARRCASTRAPICRHFPVQHSLLQDDAYSSLRLVHDQYASQHSWCIQADNKLTSKSSTSAETMMTSPKPGSKASFFSTWFGRYSGDEPKAIRVLWFCLCVKLDPGKISGRCSERIWPMDVWFSEISLFA